MYLHFSLRSLQERASVPELQLSLILLILIAVADKELY